MSRPIEASVSTFNFAPRDLLTKSANWHAARLAEMGADGELVSEMRNIHPANMRHGGLAGTLVANGTATWLHESWVANGPWDIARQVTQKLRARQLGGAVVHGLVEGSIVALMPHIDTSLDRLGRLQRAASGDLPVIVQPRNNPQDGLPVIVHTKDQLLGGQPNRSAADFHDQHTNHSRIYYQLTPELPGIREHLRERPEVLANIIVEQATTLGLDGEVLDGQHFMDERGGYQFRNPLRLAEILAGWGRVKATQITYQSHLATNPKVLQGHLAESLRGKLPFAATPQGGLLATVSNALPEGQLLPVHFEVRPAEFGTMGLRQYGAGTARLIDYARAIV